MSISEIAEDVIAYIIVMGCITMYLWAAVDLIFRGIVKDVMTHITLMLVGLWAFIKTFHTWVS